MIQAEKVTKRYIRRNGPVLALDRVDLQVKDREFLVIRGPSGSGKSTLLLILGGLLKPTEGRLTVDGVDLYRMGPRGRANFRAKNIGFVFQMFHLVPYLDVMDNVMLSAGSPVISDVQTKCEAVLDRMDLWPRRNHKPSELSAGERQRVAMARALLNNPRIVLADEPTGNLDPDNAAFAMAELAKFRDAGGTVAVVTHGQEADPWADRVIVLKEGRVVAEEGQDSSGEAL